MSRIGKNPVYIPQGVTVTVENGTVKVTGPKGELTYTHRPEILVKVEDGQVICTVKEETKESGAFWGLTRALIANMVVGVSEGYEKKLELVGVGYRVKSIDNSKISLAVGFSHPVEFEAPKGVNLRVEGNTEIFISGIDKNLVGLTAAKIRKVKKPEPYKGKGIKYSDEVIRRKAGKTGKA